MVQELGRTPLTPKGIGDDTGPSAHLGCDGPNCVPVRTALIDSGRLTAPAFFFADDFRECFRGVRGVRFHFSALSLLVFYRGPRGAGKNALSSFCLNIAHLRQIVNKNFNLFLHKNSHFNGPNFVKSEIWHGSCIKFQRSQGQIS
jgi:hypothetical protein